MDQQVASALAKAYGRLAIDMAHSETKEAWIKDGRDPNAYDHSYSWRITPHTVRLYYLADVVYAVHCLGVCDNVDAANAKMRIALFIDNHATPMHHIITVYNDDTAFVIDGSLRQLGAMRVVSVSIPHIDANAKMLQRWSQGEYRRRA